MREFRTLSDITFEKCSDFETCSFYELTEKLTNCEDNANSYDSIPLHRFFDLMRGHDVDDYCQLDIDINSSLLVDSNYELLQEKEMLETAITKEYGSRDNIREREEFKERLATNLNFEVKLILFRKDEKLLGYVVLVHFTEVGFDRIYIFESVAMPLTNAYTHNYKQHRLKIEDQNAKITEYSIMGSFFSQQSELSHTCFSASIRMAINSNEGLSFDKTVTNHTIYEIIKKLEIKKFNDEDMVQVINAWIESQKLEYTALRFDYKESTKKQLLSLIESRIAIILVNENTRTDAIIAKQSSHSVPVVGHTSNLSRWVMEDDYSIPCPAISKEDRFNTNHDWYEHYVINDDQNGPYYTLPVHFLSLRPESCQILAKKQRNTYLPKSVVLIVPDSLLGSDKESLSTNVISACEATCDTMDVLFDQACDFEGASIDVWERRFKDAYDEGNIILRAILLEKNDYFSRQDFLEEVLSQVHRDAFPDNIWVVEISLPNLYSANRRKIGEVVLGSTVEEMCDPTFAWFGDQAYVFGEGYLEKQEKRISKKHVDLIQTGI